MITTMMGAINLVLLKILVLRITNKYHITWYWCQSRYRGQLDGGKRARKFRQCPKENVFLNEYQHTFPMYHPPLQVQLPCKIKTIFVINLLPLGGAPICCFYGDVYQSVSNQSKIVSAAAVKVQFLEPGISQPWLDYWTSTKYDTWWLLYKRVFKLYWSEGPVEWGTIWYPQSSWFSNI